MLQLLGNALSSSRRGGAGFLGLSGDEGGGEADLRDWRRVRPAAPPASLAHEKRP